MQGESKSLWERISREKTKEEKEKKEEKYKLELPDLFKSIALLSAKKQGYQSSSASYTVSINTLFCVFMYPHSKELV